jgi:hypothetical protein
VPDAGVPPCGLGQPCGTVDPCLPNTGAAMTDPPDPWPPAHLPPERLVVLGLLTPFLFGVVVCSFIFFPPVMACFVALMMFACVKALVTVYSKGSKDVLLRFLVLDASTGQPIPGAKVALFLWPQQGSSGEASTCPEGTASLVAPCPVLLERGLFRVSHSVYLDSWWFEATAAGHEGTGRQCLVWHTLWIRDMGGADPPPIRVELRRLPAAGE